jgi:hypothetical protein
MEQLLKLEHRFAVPLSDAAGSQRQWKTEFNFPIRQSSMGDNWEVGL